MSAHLQPDIEPLVAAGQAQCPEKYRQDNHEKKGLDNFGNPVCPAAAMHAAKCPHPKTMSRVQSAAFSDPTLLVNRN